MHAGLVDAPTTIMTPYAHLDDGDEDADEQQFADLAPEDGQDEAGGGAEGRNNLELVLGLLHQMTFKALIRETDVDSERNAVLNGEKGREGGCREGIGRDAAHRCQIYGGFGTCAHTQPQKCATLVSDIFTYTHDVHPPTS